MRVKVLAVDGNRVRLGLEDGTMKYAELSDFSGSPIIGKYYDGYRDEVGREFYSISDRPDRTYTEASTKGRGKVVNKWTYFLLAFFLGGVGAHKFYAGKMGLGIIYLIFAATGLPAFIGIVEGVFALSKETDAYGNIVV